MAELLLELLSEEIPARMQAPAADDLKRLVCGGLKAASLEFTDARAFATPRRLALVVDGIPKETKDQVIERRGPRVGAPAQAIQGFLKATGLASLDDAIRRDTGKGEFWFSVERVAGTSAAPTVIGVIEDALQSMPWPKSMRWADHKTTWVRPLRSMVAQLDGREIPVRFYYERTADAVSNPTKYLQSASTTRGHRFLSKDAITVSGFADYDARLRNAYVILDPVERKRIMLEGVKNLCAEAQVSLKDDEGLLDEVAGLVEWPVPLLGTIDAQFMDVPPEVLIVSMRTHQRYFATTRKDGQLANRFVVVANNVAHDRGKTIVEGNERVLRARLSDAKFFWDQDRKKRLEDRLPALKDIVFHAKLGTQAERVGRIARLAVEIAEDLPGAERALVEQAALLCKADLVTGMVGEFPELQGVMGRYYALSEELPVPVAEAIGEHYAPAGPNDRCPSAPVSIAVALADKLETLVGFWAIDEQPTGSRDPFGLRRAALGVIRILIENKLRMPLGRLITGAYAEHRKLGHVSEKARQRNVQAAIDHGAQGAILGVGFDSTSVRQSLLAFFADRLKVQVREQGVRHDVVDAVFALGGEDDLVRLLARVEAVQSFLGTDAGKNLLTAYARAANIVRVEEKKDKALAAKIAAAPDRMLLERDEETDLYIQLDALPLLDRIAREDFVGAMSDLAGLREPIDAFFEKVTVNVTDRPELRLNRLKLLNQIRATMDSVADFSKIEG